MHPLLGVGEKKGARPDSQNGLLQNGAPLARRGRGGGEKKGTIGGRTQESFRDRRKNKSAGQKKKKQKSKGGWEKGLKGCLSTGRPGGSWEDVGRRERKIDKGEKKKESQGKKRGTLERTGETLRWGGKKRLWKKKAGIGRQTGTLKRWDTVARPPLGIWEASP